MPDRRPGPAARLVERAGLALGRAVADQRTFEERYRTVEHALRVMRALQRTRPGR